MLWHVLEDIAYGLIVASDIWSNRATPSPGISIFVPKCELTNGHVCYNPCLALASQFAAQGTGSSAVLTPFLAALNEN